MYYPVHTFAGITTAIQEEGKPLVQKNFQTECFILSKESVKYT